MDKNTILEMFFLISVILGSSISLLVGIYIYLNINKKRKIVTKFKSHNYYYQRVHLKIAS
jgi:hypothetical protein